MTACGASTGRSDRVDHAKRFANDQSEVSLAGGGNLAEDLVNRFGVPSDVVHHVWKVEVLAIRDRLASVDGIEEGDLPRIRHQPHQVLIDHEILPEPLPRLRSRPRQQRLNLMLGLCHRKEILTTKDTKDTKSEKREDCRLHSSLLTFDF